MQRSPAAAVAGRIRPALFVQPPAGCVARLHSAASFASRAAATDVPARTVADDPRPGLEVAPFRWAVGGLSVFLGCLMLIEPHQFETPTFTLVYPNLHVWGAALLLAGTSLLYVAALVPRPAASLGVHALLGGMYVLFGVDLALTGVWNGGTVYTLIGLGTVLAGIPLVTRHAAGRGNLLTLGAAAAGVVMGVLMVLLPDQFGAPVYDRIRPALTLFGAGFVLGSGGAIATELRLIRNPWIARLSWLWAGGMFGVYVAAVSWPTLTGVALFGGLAYAVGVQPWLNKRLPGLDPSSLRTRAALVTVSFTALPLIGAVAIGADQAERVATAQALAQQQTLAVTLAADTDDNVRLHQAAASALAGIPGLLDLSPDAAHTLLQNTAAKYPDVTAFSLYGADGQAQAASNDGPLLSVAGKPAFERTQHTNAPSLSVVFSAESDRPVIELVAPVPGADSQVAGMVGEPLDSSMLIDHIVHASDDRAMLAYLVDRQGRIMAHPDPGRVTAFADLAGYPPVAAFLGDTRPSGTLAYSVARQSGQYLVGYASVGSLGWGVIVERPATVALAGIRTARELAFGVLLVVLGSAALVTIFSTRWLTRPLALLADAAYRHASGDSGAPIPTSSLTEIARLATAFRLVQEQVVDRTVERDLAGSLERRAQQRLAAIVESSEDAIISKTLDGTITSWNPAAERLYGYTASEAIGEPVTLLVPDGEPDEVPDILDQVSRGIRISHFETMRLRKDRTLIEVSLSISPLVGADGAIEGAATIARDITRRKQHEAHIRELNANLEHRIVERTRELKEANEELESANHELEAFAYTIAHDLRAPLRAMGSYSSLLLKESPHGLSPESSHYLGRIHHNAEHMSGLIDDLLMLSRVSRQKLNKQPILPRDIARQAFGELSAGLDGRHIDFQVDDLPSCTADPVLIKQVYVNLISNALKFTRGRELRSIRLGYRPGQDGPIFSVADNGVGFDMRYAPKLFDVFQRLHPMSDFEGTGVGLSIVQRIVHRHGGHIWAEAQVDRGATFSFTLGEES